MSTIFLETMSKAISDYRYLLRRYLSQFERVNKLDELKLKDPNLYEDELALYQTGWNIVRDIELNMETKESNYYSYSGIGHFAKYLREYLENYDVENDQVIHRAQKASRAMLDAIQLLALPKDRLSEGIASKFNQYSEVIADCGSAEQRDMYRASLDRQFEHYADFYGPLLKYFDEQIIAIEQAKHQAFTSHMMTEMSEDAA